MSEHAVNIFEPQRFKICPSDSERTQLASPREEEQNLVPSGSGLGKASSALADRVASLSRSVWFLKRRGLTWPLLVLRAEVAM